MIRLGVALLIVGMALVGIAWWIRAIIWLVSSQT